MKNFNAILLILAIFITIILITTNASASDLNYTLSIYGNANEDQDLNEADIAYIDDIIAGKAEKTRLADTNNDGAINEQDKELVEQLLKNEAPFIIVLDSKNEPVKIPLPVQKVVTLNPMVAEQIEAIDASDKIVGIDKDTTTQKKLLPTISNKENVGSGSEPDYEKIVALKPNLILNIEYFDDKTMKKFQDSGLITLTLPLHGNVLESINAVKMLGFILGEQEQSKAYTDWYTQYLLQIQDKVKKLADSDRPKVMYLWSLDKKLGSSGSECPVVNLIEAAGGVDAVKDVIGNYVEIDPEYVIKSNPDYIVFEVFNDKYGYDGYQLENADDSIKGISYLSSLPGFNSVNAIKNNETHSISGKLTTQAPWLGEIYLAKLIHPELFTDLDPQSIHQEYIDKFLKIPFNVSSEGVFIYPKPANWN